MTFEGEWFEKKISHPVDPLGGARGPRIAERPREIDLGGVILFESQTLGPGVRSYTAVDPEGAPASYREVLKLLEQDAAFRDTLNQVLADAPFSAYRWETPPVSTATLDRPFEFVLLDNPSLDRAPDTAAFSEHFDPAPVTGVVTFTNLGRDALMVVPCPVGPPTAYGHLAAFVRDAPEDQRHALWSAVGTAMRERVCNQALWLSTAGAGVSWLHVRIDERPKYYGHQPYRVAR